MGLGATTLYEERNKHALLGKRRTAPRLVESGVGGGEDGHKSLKGSYASHTVPRLLWRAPLIRVRNNGETQKQYP